MAKKFVQNTAIAGKLPQLQCNLNFLNFKFRCQVRNTANVNAMRLLPCSVPPNSPFLATYCYKKQYQKTTFAIKLLESLLR